MWRPPPPPPPPLYELAGYRQLPKAAAGVERAAADLAGPEPPPPPTRPAGVGSVPPGGDPEHSQEEHHQHHQHQHQQQQQLRRKINSRERKRMQDLNVAMDALREVIVPYSAAHCQATSPPGRKLSKIATLLLARNYILLLGSALHELRRILGDLSQSGSGSGPGSGAGGTRWLLAAAAAGGLPLFAAPPPVLLSPGHGGHHHHHHHHSPDTLRAAAGKYLAGALDSEAPCGLAAAHLPGGPGAPNLCPCGVCKFPHHLVTSGLGLAAGQAAQFSK